MTSGLLRQLVVDVWANMHTHEQTHTNTDKLWVFHLPVFVPCWSSAAPEHGLTDPTFRVTDCRFGSRCVTERRVHASGITVSSNMAAERGRKTSGHDEMTVNTQRVSEHLSEISVADENTVLSRRAAQVQLGASPVQSKRRKFEGATVETQLMIGESILALTDNNVNLLASTEELKVSSDRTRPRTIRHCESLDLGDEDALTKLEELRVEFEPWATLMSSATGVAGWYASSPQR